MVSKANEVTSTGMPQSLRNASPTEHPVELIANVPSEGESLLSPKT